MSGGSIRRIRFSEDGRYLAAAIRDRSVVIWLVGEQNELHRFKMPRTPAIGLSFIPNTALLAVGGQDGTIALWDMEGERLRWETRLHTGFVWNIAATADGLRCFSCGQNAADDFGHGGTLVEWEVATGKEWRRYGDFSSTPEALSLAPDGTILAVAFAGGELRFFSTRDGVEVSRTGEVIYASGIDYSPDGELLALAGLKTVAIWDIAKRSIRYEFTDPFVQEGYYTVRFSGDGQTVVAGSTYCTSIWSLEKGEFVTRAEGGAIDLASHEPVLAIAPSTRPQIEYYRIHAP